MKNGGRCLLQAKSETNPDKAYAITLHEDGVISCACPAWRFQKGPTRNRLCKHLRAFAACLQHNLISVS